MLIILIMILEIEYYKGDVTLYRKCLDECSLRCLLTNAERVCGYSGDLAELLCRDHGFERIAADALPDWVYDRDTGKLYAPKG